MKTFFEWMKNRLIINEVLQFDEKMLERLKDVSPSTIIDDQICKSHIPFIYIENDDQKLYVGKEMSYHDQIIIEGTPEIRTKLKNAYAA